MKLQREPMAPEAKRQRCERQIIDALRRLDPATWRHSTFQATERFIQECLDQSAHELDTSFSNAAPLLPLQHFSNDQVEQRIQRAMVKKG